MEIKKINEQCVKCHITKQDVSILGLDMKHFDDFPNNLKLMEKEFVSVLIDELSGFLASSKDDIFKVQVALTVLEDELCLDLNKIDEFNGEPLFFSNEEDDDDDDNPADEITVTYEEESTNSFGDIFASEDINKITAFATMLKSKGYVKSDLFKNKQNAFCLHIKGITDEDELKKLTAIATWEYDLFYIEKPLSDPCIAYAKENDCILLKDNAIEFLSA